MIGPITERPYEDLTARARIRDAAIALFAEHGIEATSIRDIATRAGVSGGLIRHHFGSKAGLRRTCDVYVLDRFMQIKQAAISDGRLAGDPFLTSTQPDFLLYWRYFAQSLLDGSQAADGILAELVDLAQRWIEEHGSTGITNPRTYAALLVATELGVLVMREQIFRDLGGDLLGREGDLGLAMAKLEFYSLALLSPETAGRAREAIDRLAEERGASSKPGKEDKDGTPS
ncbi:MAG: helix-turn-helix domain containing protein [Nitrospiraceae bacterium]|nr:helix-turn-helix domain containing protein [Nitrospiraceae bacterium]MDA8208098.1 helix-turn-helix domain containing protein [Actinomycetota bacterium]